MITDRSVSANTNIRGGTLNRLQRFQDQFCSLAAIYVMCLDEKGNRLTGLSASEEEGRVLEQVLTGETVSRLFTYVTTSPIEDQTVEDSDRPDVVVAACRAKAEDTFLVWIAAAAIAKRDSSKTLYRMPVIEGLGRYTSETKLYAALDLLRASTAGLLKDGVIRENKIGRTDGEKLADMEQRYEMQVRRAETLTNVIGLLNSEVFDYQVKFKNIMAEAVKYIKSYLGVTDAFVIQLHKNGEYLDVLFQMHKTDDPLIFTRTENIERYWFLTGDSPQVVSVNAGLNAGERAQMDELGIRTLAVMPVQVQGKSAFFACYADRDEEHVFSVDDIKFLTDSARIMETVVVMRNQNYSYLRSYEALEDTLNNIGSAIYVRDLEDDSIVFSNHALRDHIAYPVEGKALKAVFEQGVPKGADKGNYELYDEKYERWYEIYYTNFTWFNAKTAILCAIYDITEKKVYQKRIEQQAYTDFLTGLYNRMCFERDLGKYLEDAQATGQKGVLMYIDLDDFKHINDGLGHQYGDALLKMISKALSSIDGLQGSCYRMGGDEFVVIVRPEVYARFEQILDDIRDTFAKPWYLKDADYYCTMSMGTVEFPTEGSTVTELIQKADITMYEAKKGGKNRIARYTANIDTHSGRRLDMEKNMRDATLENYREFEVYYQPIVDQGMPGTPCTGAEALVRWNSKLGFISPAEFIPLAEYLGLIAPIGNYVLAEACKACKTWHDAGKDYEINVNLSVVQLLQPDIVDVVKQAIEDSGIDASRVTLEVTESLAINDLDRTKAILMNIKRLGVNLALDDFGTGYSSLNNIRALPFDIIKVDQNFVKDLADDNYSQSFIRMIAELAEAIDADVCVEGIETQAQFNVLHGMKVRYIQGFYFDKPMPREAFEEKYVRDASDFDLSERRAELAALENFDL